MTPPTTVPNSTPASVLIEPHGLAELLAQQQFSPHRRLRLLDVRWRLDIPEGRPDYIRGHLPGAVYVDLERELAQRSNPASGRHPVPATARLERAARGWGLRPGDIVVAYDDISGVAAARLWWLLRRTGVDVRVLNGGLTAWVLEGLPIEHGDVRPPRGTIHLTAPTGDDELTADTVEEYARTGIVIDARSPEHYSGQRAHPDPLGGHIPGAINLPTLAHIDSNGRMNAQHWLRRTFSQVGITPGSEVGIYCGSGIASAHTALALHSIGVASRIYTGSWSQWAHLRGRYIATGILPYGSLQPL
ncbi:sulfurtransferase [Microbacterium sp. YY-01]